MIEKHRALPSSLEGFGVELEFHTQWDELKAVTKQETTEFLKFTDNQFCCLKTDGSCGTEVNLGIYPLSIRGINHFVNQTDQIYKDLLAAADSVCRLSHYPYNHLTLLNYKCGMHVHLSKTLFSDKMLENFLLYFYKYEKDILEHCVHSDRQKSYYAKQLNGIREYKESMAVSKNLDKNYFLEYSSHYDAVNYNHAHNTIEIRYAGMNSNIRSTKNWLLLLLFLFKESKGELKDFASLKDHLKSISKRGMRLLGDWVMIPNIEKFSYTFKQKETAK